MPWHRACKGAAPVNLPSWAPRLATLQTDRHIPTMKKLLCVGFALSLAAAANAGSPFSKGDVFAGQYGIIQQYSHTGTLLSTLNPASGTYMTGMAFDSAGTLYATAFSTGTLHRFDVNGNLLAPNPWVTNDSGADNESIVFGSSGNFYVGQADGTRDVIKRDASGGFLARYDVATDGRGSDWIDLAADQHTLFYTSEGRLVKRYDVATSTQLPDFTTLPGSGYAFALRLLGDGGLLVADTSDVKRLDAAGNVIQTYTPSGSNNLFALNLDPNGTSFWTADITNGKVYEYDIASGALQTSFDTGAPVYGLAVYGEITQAREVPDTGATALLFALGLGALAAGRSRVARQR